MKREVVAALMQAGRTDLANAVGYHRVVSWGGLIGKTTWGKEARLHVYTDSLTLEQYPPGGKTRGVMTGVARMSWWRGAVDNNDILNLVIDLAKAVKSQPWTRLTGMLMTGYKRIKPNNTHLELEFSKQKAVRAPQPVQQTYTPFTNAKKVAVTFQRDAVTLADLTDLNNEPRAFTQGPRAFKLALKTLGDWRELSFHEILSFWGQNKIKYHSYMGMD